MSWKIVYTCDNCGKEIPVVKRKDIFGREREYLQSGYLKSMGSPGEQLSMMGVDLCKDCAHKIDMEIMKWKMEVLSK